MPSHPHIFGFTSSLTLEERVKDVEKDFPRVDKLISSDLNRIRELFSIVNKDPKVLSKAELSQLNILKSLIKIYCYKLMINQIPMDQLTEDEAREALVHQRENKSLVDFIPTKLNSTRFLIEYDSNQYILKRFVYHIHFPTSQARYTLANPYDNHTLSLCIDLLSNLIERIDQLKHFAGYDKYQKLLEVPSHVDQVLAPYSHSVMLKDKVTSLRGFLFPKISAHDETRYSPEYAECVSREVSTPRKP